MTRVRNNLSGTEHGEVLIEVQRRRTWTFTEKLRAAQEASVPGVSVSSVARKYGMAPSQLFRWRKIIVDGGLGATHAAGEAPLSALRELKRQVWELERLLGKKTLENEILKEAIEQDQDKKQHGADSLKEEFNLLTRQFPGGDPS
jgi:transposase